MNPQANTASAPPRVEPTGCCPPFDPASWKEETVVWSNKLFVTDHVHCLLHVPLDMRRVVTKNQRWIDEAKARPAHSLILSADTSAWGTDLFIEVTRPVPNARMTTLSGTFSTKVYEGPFQNAGKWVADTQRTMAARGQPVEKIYFGYTACPRCARAYGKNYVILFAQHASGARASQAA